ncbi:hypothetical protein PoB_003383800 [Plakobranchus ocellatus]|uniref:Uncharacterized protein n=1 Tax=Plakobranchus ocellatus TaxID=259542 RepID=A0AAV4ALA0_9GAST|nr:hypothetical protein PoB_003383800 [Plakobranchus ocellatus]
MWRDTRGSVDFRQRPRSDCHRIKPLIRSRTALSASLEVSNDSPDGKELVILVFGKRLQEVVGELALSAAGTGFESSIKPMRAKIPEKWEEEEEKEEEGEEEEEEDGKKKGEEEEEEEEGEEDEEEEEHKRMSKRV